MSSKHLSQREAKDKVSALDDRWLWGVILSLFVPLGTGFPGNLHDLKKTCLSQEKRTTGQETSVDPYSHGYIIGESWPCSYVVLAWLCETEFQTIKDLGFLFRWHWLCRIEAGESIAPQSVSMWPTGVQCSLNLSSGIFCWTQSFYLLLTYKGFSENILVDGDHYFYRGEAWHENRN